MTIKYIQKAIGRINSAYDWVVRTIRLLTCKHICLADVVRVYAGISGRSPLIIYGKRTVTYAEMWSHTILFAQKLQCFFSTDTKGIQETPVSTALLSPNCVPVVQVQIACLEAGIPYAPLNPLYNANELAIALNEAQSQLIFVHNSLRTLYEESQSLGLIKQRVQPVYFSSHDDLNDVFEVPLCRSPGFIKSSGFIKSDVGQILFTSGTTSQPKGCAGYRLFDKPPRKQSKLLPEGPMNMFLVTNICGSIFYPMMRLVIGSKGHVEFIEDEIKETVSPFQQMFNSWQKGNKSAQLLFGDQLFWVLNHYKTHPASFKGLDLPNIFYGGLKFPVSAIETLMDIFPKSAFTQFYGSTEGGIFSVLSPEDHRVMGDSPFRKGSAGKILDISDLRIIGLKDEGDVTEQVDVPGELQAGTSLTMKRYWRNPEATAESFVKDENGKQWFRVGDVVQIDKDGYLYVMDRIKDMIILDTGRNVFCNEIEDVFNRHPSVKEVCCFGIESPSGIGESVAIAVVEKKVVTEPSISKQYVSKASVAKNGVQTESEEHELQTKLKAYAVASLPQYKVPGYVFIVDEIPRTKNDKILRRELREHFNKLINSAELVH